MIRMKKSAKVWLRVLSLALALMLLCSNTVFAADMDDVPYYSYCYWEGPSRNTAVPMRAMFEATTQISSDSLGIFEMWMAAENGITNEFGIGSSDGEQKLSLQHLWLRRKLLLRLLLKLRPSTPRLSLSPKLRRRRKS